MKLLTKASTIFDRTISLLALLAGVLLIFTMLLIDAEVVMRYFLAHSMPGVLEIVEYSLVFITFLGTTWVLRREKHVKMDLVLSRLRPRAQVLLNVTTSILCAIVCLVFTWHGVMVTWEHFQIGYFFTSALRPPSFPLLAIIPVGSFLLFIQFLRRTYGYLGSWRASLDRGQGV